MAQQGPLLASVRRLVEELPAEEILALPSPPLPVRLWVEEDSAALRVDLLAGLLAEERATRQDSLQALVNNGLRISTKGDRAAVGSASFDDLDELLEIPGEILLEAAPVARPELDVSVPEAWNVPAGWTGRQGTGKGVVVGIVDSGIDVTHASFRTAGGSTRVISLWDQTVRGVAGPPPWFPYGGEFDAATIDGHLAGQPGPFPSLDRSGHGTAVAGIAAGNGLAAPSGRYKGLAEEADLVVVALEARRGAFPSTANVIDAVKYVFEVADSLGRRAVVNVSQGVQTGAHDPEDLVEISLTDLLVIDDKRMIVSSAGNVGDAEAHARVNLTAGGTVDLVVEVPRRVGPIVLVDLWYDLADFLGVEVLDPSGSSTPLVDGSHQEVGQVGQDMYEIDGVLNAGRVGANQLQVKLRTAMRRGDVTDGQWTLRLYGQHMPSGKSVDAWLDVGDLRSPRFAQAQADSDCTVTSPATADGVLAVSSYLVTPSIGRFADSSGRGPDRRGARLEHLSAPGEKITTCEAGPAAARSYKAVAGTSYAAAHVTGAIALLLEQAPGLSRDDVVSCLTQNARSDADTALGPTAGWGAGKLDIAAALACATALPAAESKQRDREHVSTSRDHPAAWAG